MVPEIQCAVKREAKKAQKDKDKPNSTTCGSSPESVGARESESRITTSISGPVTPAPVISNGHSSTSSSSAVVLRKVILVNKARRQSKVEQGSHRFVLQEEKPVITNGLKPVSPEQEELIHRLVYFQNEYEQPSEEDLKRITVSRSQFTYISLSSTNTLFSIACKP